MDFCVYRFLTGLGVGGVFGLAVALVADSVPDRTRAPALGLLQSLSTCGNLLAGLTGMAVGALAARKALPFGLAPWQTLFLLGATPAFLFSGYDGMVAALHTLQAMYILMHRFGIYAQSTRSNPQVLRIQPPLVISEAEIDRFIDALGQTCREVDHICGALTGGVSKSSLGKHDARNEAEKEAAAAR